MIHIFTYLSEIYCLNQQYYDPQQYHIVGYFQGGKFPRIELSQLFKGKNFKNRHRLFRVPTEKKHFEGKFSPSKIIRYNYGNRYHHNKNISQVHNVI